MEVLQGEMQVLLKVERKSFLVISEPLVVLVTTYVNMAGSMNLKLRQGIPWQKE